MKGNRCLSLGLIMCLVVPLRVMAGATVYFLHDDSNPQHQKYVVDSERLLHEAMPEVDTVRVNLASAEMLSTVPKKRALVVGVGSRAALLAVDSDLPTLNTLITRHHFESIMGMYRSPVTAIYLEQPFSRMLALIRATLPRRDEITILLGPTSQQMKHEITESCVVQKLSCTSMVVEGHSGIEQALQFAADHGKVVLVLPDQKVVNVSTARNLILGAYRRGVALVGYSRALVKAGALMAVHSSPAELGEDASFEVIAILKRQSMTMPPSRYPKRYSVSVNYQLARALRLDIATESELDDAIKKGENK